MKNLKIISPYENIYILYHYFCTTDIFLKHTKMYFNLKHIIKNTFAVIMHDLLKTNGVKKVYIYKTFFPEGIIQNLYPASNEIFFLLTCCFSITLLLDIDGYNHKSTLQDTNVLNFFPSKSLL